MSTLSEVKARFTVGSRWAVTNHYVTREDHPAFGTTERTVTRATSGRVYLARDGEGESEVDWPKASQVTVDSDGTVTFYSHPRMPGQAFLTLKPLPA